MRNRWRQQCLRALASASVVVVGVAGMAAGEAVAAEVLFVTRLETHVLSAPDGTGVELARLPLGTRVEPGEKVGAHRALAFEGKKGWVPARALSRRPLSDATLCARGHKALGANNLEAAVAYLRPALDARTERRECLVELATVYGRRGEKSQEALVRARIRALDGWLQGTWCDAAQTLALTLGEDGRHRFQSGEATLAVGRYELRGDELALLEEGGQKRPLFLSIRRRDQGRLLVTRSGRELQQDFCPPAP